MRTRRIMPAEKLRLERTLPQRDKIITNIAYYTGLRVSDILNLKIQDIKAGGRVAITEKKTGKVRVVHIPARLRRQMQAYADAHALPNGTIFDVDKSTVYRSVHNNAKRLGMDNISMHSYRKAYAYSYYQKYGLRATQAELNHNNIATTCIYIFDFKGE